MSDNILIRCAVSVARVQSLADGGIRVVLDLPENSIVEMGAFTRCQQLHIVLEAMFQPIAEDGLTNISPDEFLQRYLDQQETSPDGKTRDD